MIDVRPNCFDDLSAFAAHDLPVGTVVIPRWHDGFYDHLEGWSIRSVEEILVMPEPQRGLFFRYGLDVDFGRIVGPSEAQFVTTFDNFINHSCEPNLLYDTTGNVVASRPIATGEELFVDYGFFIVNFDEDYDCRCGSPHCRGRLTRNDWKQLLATHGHRSPRFLHAHIFANHQPQ
ncbi:MAG: SET domain-containing protein-lysine N-methyltransferase [Planctomycetaceae bacterium]|nr:SET domain-containing protein-lysine N-methyltransferase [Planctomycetaceae bacterium]